jgi:predicted kinase
LHLVSTDQIRAHLYGDEAIQGDWLEIWRHVQAQFRQGVAATQQGTLTGVVYDATNARRRGRREVLQIARGLGFTRILAVWFDGPIACCLERNQQRSRQVPPEVIQTMARQLAGAPPHYQEGFDALFRIWLA